MICMYFQAPAASTTPATSAMYRLAELSDEEVLVVESFPMGLGAEAPPLRVPLRRLARISRASSEWPTSYWGGLVGRYNGREVGWGIG